MELKGNLIKLKTSLNEKNDVCYNLELEKDNPIILNNFIGSQIEISFSGLIYCIATGVKISKSYNQGYSYKSYITLPECDLCQVRPELCHFAAGTCRNSDWGKENCFIPHIVYLSETSDVKVGITRKRNLINRWIDQGALQAIQLMEVSNRLEAGKIEVELKKYFKDITNWRKMLKKKSCEENLLEVKRKILTSLFQSIDLSNYENITHEVLKLNYPIEDKFFAQEKVTSLSLDKEKKINGELLGIKGQYLLLSTGVFNLRKYQGYQVDWKFS